MVQDHHEVEWGMVASRSWYSVGAGRYLGVPKIRGNLSGVLRTRTLVLWGVYLGVPLVWETTISRNTRVLYIHNS